MKKPCAECPWRTDVCTGRFPADRFRILAPTAYDMNMVQFVCHKSPEGEEVGCAGYVLRGSLHNLGARLSAQRGSLILSEVSSPYPLYENFKAMAIANGVPDGDPVLAACRGNNPDD